MDQSTNMALAKNCLRHLRNEYLRAGNMDVMYALAMEAFKYLNDDYLPEHFQSESIRQGKIA